MIESLTPSLYAFRGELDDPLTEATPESTLAVATNMASGLSPLDVGFEDNMMTGLQVGFEFFFTVEDAGT